MVGDSQERERERGGRSRARWERNERNDDEYGLGVRAGITAERQDGRAIKSFYINHYYLIEIAKRNMLPPAAPG